MKRKNVAILVLVLSLLGALMLLLKLDISNSLFTEQNTKELTATVTQVDIATTSGGQIFFIHTEEFNAKLVIENDSLVNDCDYLATMPTKQMIWFRVDSDTLDSLEEESQVNIVALRTSEKNIVTIESSNDYQQRERIRLNVGILLDAAVRCRFALPSIWYLAVSKKATKHQILETEPSSAGQYQAQIVSSLNQAQNKLMSFERKVFRYAVLITPSFGFGKYLFGAVLTWVAPSIFRYTVRFLDFGISSAIFIGVFTLATIFFNWFEKRL